MRAPGRTSLASSENVVEIRLAVPATSRGVIVTCEPVFKATFQLTVSLPADLAVVSNTPAAHTETVPGAGGMTLKKTVFAQTSRMSTYLLVLCAGHLERIHDASSGADIGVFAVTGKAEQGRYALEAADKILPYYNNYFGLKYPLPKRW